MGPRRSAVVADDSPLELIAVGPPMTDVIASARRVAPTSSSVLIQGETGTGKELLARLIHRLSPRAKGPFIAVNCGALSEGLLASELFGHEKGAFTGADRQRPGKFEVADDGTLFLDEIGDVSLRLQVMLLRVLQERCFERVGGNKTIDVDVRVVAASHHSLEQLVSWGEFRQDLYYRLNVFPIRVPPLRERLGDLPALAHAFLTSAARDTGKPVHGIAPHALSRLLAYPWPGNVRELQNAMERAVILCDDDVLDEATVARVVGVGLTAAQTEGIIDEIGDDDGLDDAPTTLTAPDTVDAADTSPVGHWQVRVATELKKRFETALVQSGGNVSRAAKLLGMKRSTFIYQARKIGLL